MLSDQNKKRVIRLGGIEIMSLFQFWSHQRASVSVALAGVVLGIGMIFGCGSREGSGDVMNTRGLMGAKLVAQVGDGSSRLTLKTGGARRPWALLEESSVTEDLMDDFKGVYFGELEIVAYNYRPGESVQSNMHSNEDADWSHWVVVQSGHDDGRDNVLSVAGPLDFAAMNGDYGRSLDQEFINQVGAFRVDLFEVYFHRTGIVHGERYIGMNTSDNGGTGHPLKKYSDWSGYAQTHVFPLFPGSVFRNSEENPHIESDQDLSVFFARDDWFETPLLVRMGGGGTNRGEILEASRDLSAHEAEILTSLVDQGTQRRGFSRLVVIPFQGPPTFDLSNEIPPLVTVTMDFSEVLDLDETDLEVEPPVVSFKGDDDDIPFGLSISF
jgi:hypothetical protein